MKKYFRYTHFIPQFNKSATSIALLTVLLISILDLFGWVFNIPFLKYLDPNWTPMRVITALFFMFSAAALYLIQTKIPSEIKRTFASIIGILISLISLLTIVAYVNFINNGK